MFLETSCLQIEGQGTKPRPHYLTKVKSDNQQPKNKRKEGRKRVAAFCHLINYD